jgi:hypothetical protein
MALTTDEKLLIFNKFGEAIAALLAAQAALAAGFSPSVVKPMVSAAVYAVGDLQETLGRESAD